ncbi:hypothetical protein AKH09_20755 [Vibrio parahaemolyticus]|nr:hypothetical protein AKH09_20755 [Vibrio parahaemolyticus]
MLLCPSCGSDRRLETAPDLSVSKHVNGVLEKLQLPSKQIVMLGNYPSLQEGFTTLGSFGLNQL